MGSGSVELSPGGVTVSSFSVDDLTHCLAACINFLLDSVALHSLFLPIPHSVAMVLIQYMENDSGWNLVVVGVSGVPAMNIFSFMGNDSLVQVMYGLNNDRLTFASRTFMWDPLAPRSWTVVYRVVRARPGRQHRLRQS